MVAKITNINNASNILRSWICRKEIIKIIYLSNIKDFFKMELTKIIDNRELIAVNRKFSVGEYG